LEEHRNVPLSDLAAAHRENAAALEEAALGVLRSGRYILGPEVAAFEEELATYAGVGHAVGVASGSDGLLLVLQALDLPPGSKVVTTPFTFFATVSCIVRLGHRPVFVDIDPVSFNLDVERAGEAASDPEVRAVIGVDLYGDPPDYDALREAVGRPEVKIVEDAAQSFGAEVRGRRAGSLADAATFSFFPAKNLGAAGDGGAVVSDDAELADHVRILRVHGARPKYRHHVVGYNSRLDPLQAAMLRVKLRRIEEAVRRRRRIAERYAPLAEVAELPRPRPGHRHSYNYFVVSVPRRDELAAYLTGRGVGNALYYPEPLHLQPCFAALGYGEGDLPAAEAACRRVIALPMYPQLTEADQDYVIETVLAFYR
jgi:dTDP-4-amino-4,6-dideoxygalactose transaminase